MGCAPYTKLQSVPIFFLIGLFFCIHLLSRRNYKPFTALILSSVAPSLAIACYVIGNDLQQFFLESYIKANLWYTKYDISGEVAHSLFDKLVTLFDLLANNVASLAPIAAVTAVTVYVVFKSILQSTIIDLSKDKIFLLLFRRHVLPRFLLPLCFFGYPIIYLQLSGKYNRRTKKLKENFF